MTTESFKHIPVMAKEIIKYAAEVKPSGVIIDATLGGGGHSKLLLEARKNDKLIAFDRDYQAVEAATKNLENYRDRFEIIHTGFANIGEEIRKRNLEGEVVIVLFDLGVSSHQLDKKSRGFTYREQDAPLDMRMDSRQELSASTIINEFEEAEIARIIRENGDEKFANKIAKKIVENRPISTSGELIEVIRMAIPHKFQRLTHPAKRTFQALRMEVNKELDQLRIALEESVHLLAPGGRVLVLSYHSGEDKIVKSIFSKYFKKEKATKDGRLLPEVQSEVDINEFDGELLRLIPITRTPKKPSAEEIAENRRSKSAKLRVVEREAPIDFAHVSGM